MRKLYSILAVLMLGLSTPAFAQLDELSGQSVTIGEAAESMTPGQWYLVYNKREYAYSGGGYWWDYAYSTGGAGSTGTIYMSYGPDVVYDGQAATGAAPYMIRFIESGTDGQYYAQFGTGDYVWTPTSTGGTVLQTVTTIYDAKPLKVELIAETAGHFAFYTASEGYPIDNNGTGATVVTWGTDTKTESDLDGNADWTIYPVELTVLDEDEAAALELASTYKTYSEYSGTFTTGTDPGCYGEAEVEAFEAALLAAANALDPEPGDETEYTTEQLVAMGEAIEAAYAAVIDSQVPYNSEITPGYYYIQTYPDFYYETVTTEDTEDPETGEIISGTTETTYPTKGMYAYTSSGTVYGGWATAEATAPFLWKIGATDEDKVYTLVNMGLDAAFTSVSTSTAITMSTETLDTGMSFDMQSTLDDGTVIYCIRVNSQSAGSYYYIHQNNHSSGAGTGSNLVGWSNSTASMWHLVAVTDAEAEAMIEAYAPIKDEAARYENACALIEQVEAEMVIATDVTVGDEPLITDVDQLSSPYTEESEGALDYLIDGDEDTYWHSNWSDGSVSGGTHYLQVELAQAYESLVLSVTRRNSATNDHVTEWGVYGVSGDTETALATLSTPYSGDNTETVVSGAFTTGGFTTLRFYINDTYYSSGSTRGYGHAAEIQLYEAVTNETSQKVAMGSVYTDMETAIANAEAEGEDLTLDTYNALLAAYEAWAAKYVDPTELRSTIADVASAAEGMVIGSNPGEWTDASSATALNATIEAATAYDASGVYTQTQTDTYVATLTAQAEAILDAANKVATGKWYKMHLASEDEYETYGWSTSNMYSDTYGSLYDKYVVIANNDGSYGVDYISKAEAEEVCAGQRLYFDDENNIVVEDLAKFRFVSVGDTAYVIQNKATGMYLNCTGSVLLSPHPSLFTVTPLGYGQNLITAKSLTGDDQSNLHAQLAYNILVTWSTATAGSNSAIYIEEAEDVAADYDGSEFNMSLVYGQVYAMCYASSISSQEATLYGVEVDGTTVTLKPLPDNTAEPGQPFICINGTTDQYDAEAEEEPVAFTHGETFAAKAGTSGKLVGLYEGETIGSGKLVASANTIKVGQASSTSVDDNEAYIDGDFDLEATIVVEISDEIYDGVNAIAATLAKGNGIYTAAGQRVSKISAPGLYIVNGVKLLVK